MIRSLALACALLVPAAAHAATSNPFVIAMPDTDAALALLVGERLRQKIAGEPFLVQDGSRQLTVTVSIGINSLISGEDTPQTLLKRADDALYRAKRAGRNRVVAAAA